MEAASTGTEASQIAEHIQRQYRHWQVALAEIRKGIEAGRDDAMTLALAAKDEAASAAGNGRLQPRMLAQIFARTEIEQAEINAIRQRIDGGPSGDGNLSRRPDAETKYRVAGGRHHD